MLLYVDEFLGTGHDVNRHVIIAAVFQDHQTAVDPLENHIEGQVAVSHGHYGIDGIRVSPAHEITEFLSNGADRFAVVELRCVLLELGCNQIANPTQFGMAIGIVLLDLTPGYHVDLMSYLFGSILTVPASDLWMMLACQAVVVAIVSYYYQDFLAMAYDEEFAKVRGVPVNFLYTLMIIMLAVSVVMIIQVVGLILVIALLTIGPFIVEKYTKSLVAMMLWSSSLNVVFAVCGLWMSYTINVTSGAAIIIVAASGFFIDQLYYRFYVRNRRRGALVVNGADG